MDAEDSDWKEIFRRALLDASRDVADMIIVLDPEYVEMPEVLATISDIRAYGFRLTPHFLPLILFVGSQLEPDHGLREEGAAVRRP